MTQTTTYQPQTIAEVVFGNDESRMMIEDIIRNFDFKKCHIAMKALNWKWAISAQVPSIEMLKESAVDRLKCAIMVAKEDKCPKSTFFSSSGGLKASAYLNRYGHVQGLLLEFVLTDWDSDGDY